MGIYELLGAEVNSRCVKVKTLQQNESIQYSSITVTFHAASCLSYISRITFSVYRQTNSAPSLNHSIRFHARESTEKSNDK